jgi:hypothetical protein
LVGVTNRMVGVVHDGLRTPRSLCAGSERLTEGGVARLGAGPGLDLVSGQVLVWRWVDRSVVCSAVPQSHPTPSSTLEVNRSPCWSPTLTPTSPSAGCPTTCRTSGPRHEIRSYDHASISAGTLDAPPPLTTYWRRPQADRGGTIGRGRRMLMAASLAARRWSTRTQQARRESTSVK